MARPREFDIDVVLEDAMGVFWLNGYEGASLPKLLDGTGLTRGSLYKAFDDKKTLFLKTLEKYDQDAVAPAVLLLENNEIANGKDRINLLFDMVVDTVRQGDDRGCMLCTTAASSASEDPDIEAEVQRLLGKMRNGFKTALNQSTKSNSSKTKGSMASLLLTHYVGLRVLSRSRAPIDHLEDSVRSLKNMLAREYQS